MVQTLIASVVS